MRLTVFFLYAKDISLSLIYFNYTGGNSRDKHDTFCGFIRNRILNFMPKYG